MADQILFGKEEKEWRRKVRYACTKVFLILLVPLYSCCQKYDSALMRPDIDDAGMNHGDYLTPLGCLLYTPMAYIASNEGYNVAVYHNGREINSVRVPYSELQKEIILEFQRDGTLKYWFKKDYIKSPFDTGYNANGDKYVSHTIRPSAQLTLKRIYVTGKWKANFKDSTLTIDFGKNDVGLLPLIGKYTRLGAGSMDFRQTTYFDSLTNGKMESYERHINTYFEYY